MSIIKYTIEKKLNELKDEIMDRLYEIAQDKLDEYKVLIAEDHFEYVELDEAVRKRNPNIIRMGRIQQIRRRVRRNKKGMIVVQRNRKRSSLKGYRIKGNTVRRIPATARIKKSRLLKRSWKTTRRAKLRRSLAKRKFSMRRRSTLGLR